MQKILSSVYWVIEKISNFVYYLVVIGLTTISVLGSLALIKFLYNYLVK